MGRTSRRKGLSRLGDRRRQSAGQPRRRIPSALCKPAQFSNPASITAPCTTTRPSISDTNRMNVADVGLMGMYIADCDALAGIAEALGKISRSAGAAHARRTLPRQARDLWDEPTGIFLNKNLDTGQLSPRLSPTNFYPMLAQAATPRQAGRMVQEASSQPQRILGRLGHPLHCPQPTLPSKIRNTGAAASGGR